MNGLRLFVVNVWGWHPNCEVAEEPFTHVVIAKDMTEAETIAIQQQKEYDAISQNENAIKWESYSIDRENSFEVDRAIDRNGIEHSVAFAIR